MGFAFWCMVIFFCSGWPKEVDGEEEREQITALVEFVDGIAEEAQIFLKERTGFMKDISVFGLKWATKIGTITGVLGPVLTLLDFFVTDSDTAKHNEIMAAFKEMASEFEVVKNKIEELDNKIDLQTCKLQVFEYLNDIDAKNGLILNYINNPTQRTIEDSLNSMEEINTLRNSINSLLANLNGENPGAEPCLDAMYEYYRGNRKEIILAATEFTSALEMSYLTLYQMWFWYITSGDTGNIKYPECEDRTTKAKTQACYDYIASAVNDTNVYEGFEEAKQKMVDIIEKCEDNVETWMEEDIHDIIDDSTDNNTVIRNNIKEKFDQRYEWLDWYVAVYFDKYGGPNNHWHHADSSIWIFRAGPNENRNVVVHYINKRPKTPNCVARGQIDFIKAHDAVAATDKRIQDETKCKTFLNSLETQLSNKKVSWFAISIIRHTNRNDFKETNIGKLQIAHNLPENRIVFKQNTCKRFIKHKHIDWGDKYYDGYDVIIATLDTIIQDCKCEAHIGKSAKENIQSATVKKGCKCPAVINSSNWLGGHSYDDVFKVTQKGTSIQVKRTDKNCGWGMDLMFMCN